MAHKLRLDLGVTVISEGQADKATIRVEVTEPERVAAVEGGVPFLRALEAAARPNQGDWIRLRARIGAKEDLRVSVTLYTLHSLPYQRQPGHHDGKRRGGADMREVSLPPETARQQEQTLDKRLFAKDNFIFTFSLPPADPPYAFQAFLLVWTFEPPQGAAGAGWSRAWPTSSASARAGAPSGRMRSGSSASTPRPHLATSSSPPNSSPTGTR